MPSLPNLALPQIGGAFKSILNPLIWLIIIIAVIVFVWGFLVLRKRKKLVYPCIEYINIGSNKSAHVLHKAGYFGKKLMLRGLLWSGPMVMRLANGDEVYDFTTEDFHRINGRPGVVCYRDPVRRKLLFPIKYTEFKNEHLIAKIAPGDFVGAGVDNFNEAVKETTNPKTALIMMAISGIIIVICFIIVLFTVQYVKAAQKDAGELMLKAGETGVNACKSLCRDIVSTVISKPISP